MVCPHIIIWPLLLSSVGLSCYGVDLQLKFRERVEKLTETLINKENLRCNFWTSLLKVHLKRTDDFCFEGFRNMALDFCGSDYLPGIVWLASRYWNDGAVEKVVKGDIMMRLTDLPFWIDEQGAFEDSQNPNCLYNYWMEDDQLVWLTGAYLIGHSFFTNPSLSDVLFTGTDGTGHELIERSRHRLWKWLDQRQIYGFNSKITSMPKMISCLSTLSVLAPDKNFQTFSSIILWLLVYQYLIQARLEQSSFSSSILRLFSEDSDNLETVGDEDVLIPFLMSLRSMSDEEASLKVPNYILELADSLLRSQSDGLELIMDQPNTQSFLRKEIQLEDCIFIFTLFGIDSSESIDCFISLGHKYSLWKRHKTWKSKMWMKNLALRSFELSFIDKEIVELITKSDYSNQSSKFFISGDILSASSFQNYESTFQVEALGILQRFSSTGSTQPKNFHSRELFVQMYNPTIFQSAISNLKPSALLFPKDVTNTSTGWFITQSNQTFLGIYSWMPVTFDSGKVVSNSSRNIWIWKVAKFEDFEDSIERFSNSLMMLNISVKSHPDSSFEKCLEENECLGRGPLRFIDCLSTTCPTSLFETESNLSKCLMQSSKQSRLKRSILFNFGVRRGDIEYQETTTTTRDEELKPTTVRSTDQRKSSPEPPVKSFSEDWFDIKREKEVAEKKIFEVKDGILKKLSNLAKCLDKPTSDLILTIQSGNQQDIFRWSDLNDFDRPNPSVRFKSNFGTVFWNDKLIHLKVGEYFLKLDFENLQIISN